MASFVDRILIEYQTTGTAALLANNKKIIDSFKALQEKSQNFGAIPQLAKSADQIREFGRSLSFVGFRATAASLPLDAFGKQAFDAAVTFDQSMTKVRAAAADTNHTISDQTFNKMEQAVKDIARNSVIPLNDLADGFYELVSAGLSVDDAMKALKPSAKFAEAAQIDMGQATQFSSQMMKVFGDKTHDTGKILDITSIAVQKSQAHFDDFTHNVQMTASFAKDANQSYEQLSAALMILADRGVPAASAGFQLRQAFSQMIKPTKQAKDEIERLNLHVYDGQGNFRQLSDILKDLRVKTAGMTEEQRNNTLSLLFNVRAGQAVRTLLQLSNEDYQKYIDVVSNATGATDQMAGSVENSLSGKIKKLQNQFSILFVDLGTKLIPIFKKFGDHIMALADHFFALNPKTQEFIINLGLLFAAFGPVMVVLGSFLEVIGFITGTKGLFGLIGSIGKTVTAITEAGGLTAALEGASAAFVPFLAPLLITIGVAAAVGGLLYLITKLNETKDTTEAVAGSADVLRLAHDRQTEATNNLKQAQEDLKQKNEILTKTSQDVHSTQEDITRAMLGAYDATLKVQAAKDALNQADKNLNETAKELHDTNIALADSFGRLGDAALQPAGNINQLQDALHAARGQAYDFNGVIGDIQNNVKGANELFKQPGAVQNALQSSNVGNLLQSGTGLELKHHRGGLIHAPGFAAGGMVPGQSALQDRVPALLTPGEGVMSKQAIENFLQTGMTGGSNETNISVHFDVGTMIATPGERAEFFREIREFFKREGIRLGET